MTVNFNIDQGAVEEAFTGMTAAARIAYTVEYAVYVELPTAYSGSQPPFQPIYEWVQRKWGDLSAGLKDAGLSESVEPGSDQHVRSVAWVVVKAIAENGTEGVFFAKRSLQKLVGKADALAARYEGTDDPEAGRKIVQDAADLSFEESQRIVADEATDTGNLLQSGQIEIYERAEQVPEAG